MTTVEQAFDMWRIVDDDAGSIESGIEALDEIARACRGVEGTGDIVAEVEKLRALYVANGGDPDGIGTKRLINAYWRFTDDGDALSNGRNA